MNKPILQLTKLCLNRLVFTCLLCIVFGFDGYNLNAQSKANYVWKNAPIGGGGFVTGIINHQTSGDRYCRTDVGGAYRWDAANNKWIQLLDWINESESGFTGVDALALDPQNANNVYMLCGTDYFNNGRTAILKSTDKGNTFTYTDVTSKFKTHGNGNGRGNGERLAVDPKNSNILFCGSRANGLWKSTDAGVTWNLAWNGVTTTANGNGICFVQFDPSSSVVNGASQTIYIGVSRTGGGNIYKSTNGGATFNDISATIDFMPHRAALQGTTMYVTYSDNEGPGTSGGLGKVYKLNTTTGAWTNVTPAHWQDYPYGGVSIDPNNVNRVVISTCGMYWNNQYGSSWGDFVFLSTDGGSTWTLKNGPDATYDNDGIGWASGTLHWAGSIEFTPGNTAEVRAISGNGVFSCSNIDAANPSWKFDVRGMEETGMTGGISIPGGPFISTFGDITGFVHNDLTSYPASTHQPADGSNWSIAYATANTNKIVRVGSSNIYYSNDKGATWTASATNMGAVAQSKVAISADGGTTLNIPHGSTTTYYTTNDGGSWSSCSGVSTSYIVPVADQVNSNYFYIYNPENGQMLSSSNKGVSFSVAGTPGTNSFQPWEITTFIRTVPGLEGHLWVPLGGNGLKYSTDHGATYTTLANVSYCRGVGIGKAMAGASYPTLFIWGTVSGVTGLFRSTDQGATWGARMNDDAHEFGGASMLIGDMNVDGRVYMASTGGRGLIYWDPSGCTPTTITPYVQINGGSWEQTASASLGAGDTVQFSPQPTTGGSWNWSGPNGFNATTREVTIANIQSNQAGNYVASYTNSEGCHSEQTFNVTDTTSSSGGTGTILREYWTGISGPSISNLTSNTNYPNNPSGSEQLTSLEGPTNWADDYGTRIRGYIHPTTSGSYTFWVAGDDKTELYLSTNDNPANATRIAYVDDWTNSREWGKYTTQQSASVNLTAGQKYYVAVLHKDGNGGDNVAVAWEGPGITQQVIGGNYLSPYVPGTNITKVLFNENFGTWPAMEGGDAATYTGFSGLTQATYSGSNVVIQGWGGGNGYEGASGNATFLGKAPGEATPLVISDISISGYDSLNLSFGLAWQLWWSDPGIPNYRPTIEIKVDNGEWILLTQTDSEYPTMDQEFKVIVMPIVDANGNKLIGDKLSIRLSAASNGANYRLDDLIVSARKATVPAQSITVTTAENVPAIVSTGNTLQLLATVLPDNTTNKNITWTIGEGSEKATISSTGLLTAIADGIVKVRATAQDGTGVFGELAITIVVNAQSITVATDQNVPAVVSTGNTLQLLATVLPENTTNKNVSWTVVEGSEKATISSTGLLTAIADGIVTVRATAQDGTGVFGELAVSIVVNAQSITVATADNIPAMVWPGSTLQLQASVLPDNTTNKNVTWTISEGSENATISSTGLLTAIANGIVIVRATTQDGSGVFNEMPVTITDIIAGRTYAISARHSGKVLSVDDKECTSSIHVKQDSYTGALSQQWQLEEAGNGYYKLLVVCTGKSLTISKGSSKEGAKAEQATYIGGANQKWRIEETGGGYYKLIAVHSNKALTVSKGKTKDGAEVEQASYTGEAYQQWKFEHPASSNARISSNVEQEEVEKSVLVYPNPISESTFQVSLVGFESETALLKITSQTGDVVFESVVSHENLVAITKPLKPGIYIVQVLGTQGVVTTKVIVR